MPYALTRFGTVAFCSEADVALERLRVAISDANRAGFLVRGPNAAYDNAVTLYNQESDWKTGTLVAWGGACTNLTNELQRAADRLNAEIVKVGGSKSPIYRPDYTSDPAGWDALPGVAKVAIGVGSLALVVWGLNSVATLVGALAPSRAGRSK